jgi:hypothetical protein
VQVSGKLKKLDHHRRCVVKPLRMAGDEIKNAVGVGITLEIEQCLCAMRCLVELAAYKVDGVDLAVARRVDLDIGIAGNVQSAIAPEHAHQESGGRSAAQPHMRLVAYRRVDALELRPDMVRVQVDGVGIAPDVAVGDTRHVTAFDQDADRIVRHRASGAVYGDALDRRRCTTGSTIHPDDRRQRQRTDQRRRIGHEAVAAIAAESAAEGNGDGRCDIVLAAQKDATAAQS